MREQSLPVLANGQATPDRSCIPKPMRHHLKMQQWVPYRLGDVFNFFANPQNLPPLMPRWQAARIDSSNLTMPPAVPASRTSGADPVPTPAQGQAAGEGSRMMISFRPVPLSPVRMKWDARIAEFRWDDHFCDEQLSGPFGYWRHCHHVHEELRGDIRGTSVTDDVTYAFPFGPLGDLAWLFGGALQVRSLFRYRQRQLLKLLPASITAAQ